MKELFGLIEKLAGRQVSIALTGPTGSGKGVIARAIHQVSPRSKHPFIVLDCANQDPNLVRSELFGHVRGSFTGANQDRAGVFEAANGGTLFIDEIGELSQELQPRLLRVLEDRQVVRIGSHVPVDVNVRIVSATHRDLYQMVDDGDFRQDLLYRLCVVELEVPPLAARLDDLEDLCHGFLEESGEEGRIPLDSAIIEKLSEHTWPGNVRELRNVIERALAYAGEDPLNISHISYRSVAAGPIRGSIQDSERDLILRTLQETDGNKTETARKLNIAYTTLKRRIHKYGLDED